MLNSLTAQINAKHKFSYIEFKVKELVDLLESFFHMKPKFEA